MLRRKIEAKARPADPPPAGAERAWRLALARSGRDAFALAVEVSGLTSARRSLTELLEMPEARSLYAVLEGPGEALGLAALSPPVLSALIEVQTIGRVSAAPTAVRKPTRTDAAMVSGFLDRALADLDQQLEAEEDRVWAAGFRYASFLDDPRPLGLLLEDCTYRVLVAEVELALGAKTGPLLLALPADGRGERPALPDAEPAGTGAEPSFSAALSEQVLAADCRLDAVLERLTLPLGTLMGWQVGDVVELPKASLERIAFEGLDGRPVAEGRLGQHRGMRAVRLSGAVAAPAAGATVMPLPMTGTDD
ncbi:FliM/FliN family flagellar motor switch protein [Cereibacter sphaeroides]|uniref:FliM/FliN family flagellar motor switch protein n=1 Tax=Cereibacter sphaeroides TaxID=1063 RepID=UPI001F1F350F|nr:flagellar motor switch protein FliM [Cereibacter sphaeroides]MCE6962226.1 FliM/FliN family flagellar motor switch protein [Cereibacter sphaeroides]MCE6971002.1 FliM/FliN family flagellar motor switch protein [Cereibacter sphaeroides]MCE6972404.1 FliM/FliN family flagellar motor switch protein [Cereibacter sphaeroides]